MSKRIIPIFFVLIMLSALVWRRFDVPMREDATVIASTSPTYALGDRLHRGQVLETAANEYLAITIGDARIGLSERTTITLERLFKNERVIHLTRGRIIADNPASSPLFINTLKTQNTVTQATATFIDFDFLQTVHIIPLKRNVQTSILGSNEFLLLPVPIAVHETEPPTYQPISFDPSANAAQTFYIWFQQLNH